MVDSVDSLSDRNMNIRVDKQTVEQFTGLKDKNGVDIYEGDVIRISGERYTDKVVIWRKEVIAFALVDLVDIHNLEGEYDIYQHKNNYWWQTHKDDIEIIGNIHDNPELMEGGEQ